MKLQSPEGVQGVKSPEALIQLFYSLTISLIRIYHIFLSVNVRFFLTFPIFEFSGINGKNYPVNSLILEPYSQQL